METQDTCCINSNEASQVITTMKNDAVIYHAKHVDLVHMHLISLSNSGHLKATSMYTLIVNISTSIHTFVSHKALSN